MTNPTNTRFSVNENESDDDFIEYLLENIDAPDKLSDCSNNESVSTTLHEPTSLLENVETDSSIVVYVKKRKYVRKQELKRDRKQRPITFPRIVKSDLRRKYMFMYENVINSYDYQLICSFFHQFMKEDIALEVMKVSESGEGECAVLTTGITRVAEFFLLMLQAVPDKVTRVCNVQLKQLSNDLERTEVSCRFTSCNTKCYEIRPNVFPKMIVDMQLADWCQFKDEEEGYCDSLNRRKRKLYEGFDEEHRKLFDPIVGTFIKSRFRRSNNPVSVVAEGSLSLFVNQDKLIDRVRVCPMVNLYK